MSSVMTLGGSMNKLGTGFFLVLMLLSSCENPVQQTTKYIVTFNSQGGTAVASQTIASGGLVTAPAAPTRSGYNFTGWFKEAGTVNAWTFASDTVSGNLTLFAGWSALPTFTVTYDGNQNTAGQAPVDSNFYISGATVTALSPGGLARTGYTFLNWNTKADGTGSNIAVGSIFTKSPSNLVLYAKWLPNGIVTPSFTKSFSGSVDTVLANFTLPAGLYRITVNTTGFFQLFDVATDDLYFNLSSGQAVNAETFIKSSGADYIFRTDNTSAAWTLTFTDIDLSNPSPISDFSSVSASVPKVFGPYLLDLGMYTVTMNTNGFFQLFPLDPATGQENSYIFNESSGNFGSQNTYTPTRRVMLFRTDNVSEAYQVDFTPMF